MQAINKLPVEVLSLIFVMGENMHCGPRVFGLPYVGFQDLVVQICHRWRKVAIGTPKLWTYIFISRSPPHFHAELYISRSGTLTLHIDLTTQNSSVNFHPSHQYQLTEGALQTLDSIEKAGGEKHRWRSLIVDSKSLSEIISVYLSLTKSPTPSLRFVSMKWSTQGSSGNGIDLGLQLFRPYHTTLAHGAQRPQLSHVEFNGLPRYCIFDRDSPLVSNLTRFTFVCPVTMSLPSHEEFSAVLSASSRLQHLSVDMRRARFNFVGVEPGPTTVASLQVHLPLLRSFSLDTNNLYRWCLYLLWIIDAPGVSDLAINTHYSTLSVSSSALTRLHLYLAEGRVNEALQCHASLDDNIPGSGPLFPWLKHLSIERIARTTSIFPLFTAFPMVSRVTLGGVGVAALANYPEHLLKLSCVTYISDGTLSLLRAVECLKRITSNRTILTLIWCMDLRVHGSTLLGLEADGIHLGSERHYRSPPGWHVEHIIVRQIYQAPEDQYDKDEDDYLGIGGLFERR